jgi:beta-glucanase (GH16 family)
MFRKPSILIITILAVTTSQAQTSNPFQPDFSSPPPTKDGHKLVWNDEFNIAGPADTTHWKYERGFVRNEELQWYQEGNGNCKNGLFEIEGRREKIKNNRYDSASNVWQLKRPFAEYTSASIQTRGHHEWLYGRFEIRARIDTAKGSWPAIWTLGTHDEWPRNGEIDIMEFYRKENKPVILANVAWGTEKRFVGKWNTKIKPLGHFTNRDPDWVKKFHVWRMDWTSLTIKIYLDDELLNETSLSETINADGSNPFLRPQFLLLNLAIGSNGGDPSKSKTPIRYEVDYVRVYQKEE